MFKKYRVYAKDNPHGYWFKRKPYGWGWVAVTWQGWLVLLLFITIVVWNFIRIDSHSHSVSDTFINFIPETFVLALLVFLVCLKKGEKPRWQWGLNEKNDRG